MVQPPPPSGVVARCAEAVEGDAETKLQALRDAILGAFSSSDRPPTAPYIWGKLAHFLAHVERGRSLRLAQDTDNPRAGAPA